VKAPSGCSLFRFYIFISVGTHKNLRAIAAADYRGGKSARVSWFRNLIKIIIIRIESTYIMVFARESDNRNFQISESHYNNALSVGL
jgi:hypothetical protein